jgi:glycine/D-amino acid oxidase-like deaminating enzyme
MDVVVVGAGQAGLAVSHALAARGVDHVVLEADRVASAWRHRWESFTLVTPNWTLALPDAPYAGDDPEGHVSRDQIVDYPIVRRRAHGRDPRRRERRPDRPGYGPVLARHQRGADVVRRSGLHRRYRRLHWPPLAGCLPTDHRARRHVLSKPRRAPPGWGAGRRQRADRRALAEELHASDARSP